MIMMRRQMTETRERQHVGAGMSSKIFQSAQPPKIFHCLWMIKIFVLHFGDTGRG